MRKNKFLLCIGLASLLLATSCKDFLDPDVTNKHTFTDDPYTQETEVEQALNGLYHGLRKVPLQRWFLAEVRSDNAWSDIYPNAQRDYSDIGNFRTNIANLGTISNAWNDLYLLIANANTFLKKIEPFEFTTTDNAIKDQFIAEARFLRGLAYFELVRYFGRVPLVLEPIAQEQAAVLTQSSAQEIYEKAIIPDLKFAAETLPETPRDVKENAMAGKATWMAAKSILGQVYLTLSGYPLNQDNKGLAKALFEEVLTYADAQSKFWATDANQWRHIWTNEQDNNYHIFEVQFISGGLDLGNPMVFETTPGLYSGYTEVRLFGNTIWADRALVEEYLRGSDSGIHDVRLNGTVDTTRFVNTDVKPAQTYSGEPFFVKFLEHKIKRSELGLREIEKDMTGYEDWPINFPIMRLEDVMLMYAEIVGPTTEGLDMVNRIRTRAGAQPVSTSDPVEFMQFVERERRLELAGEGVRWHDLVRWNVWQDRIKDKYYRYAYNESTGTYNEDWKSYGDRVAGSPGLYLYPIPEAQMVVKDGLYTQNEGYDK